MAKYDNSGRLEEDGEKDWREALNLSKDYVSEWKTFIAEPLQWEVSELRQEVAELRYAIQRISDCPHRSDCPVLDQLQRQPQGE